MYALWRLKMLKSIKKAIESFKYWVNYYPPELKEMQKQALETNRVYESALQKAKPALKKATTRSKTVPLKKSTSKAAFKSNVAKEIKEGGKPVKQAVAIAYAVKKEATKKAKK